MWEERVQIEGPYNFDLALDRLAMDPLHMIDSEKGLYGSRFMSHMRKWLMFRR